MWLLKLIFILCWGWDVIDHFLKNLYFGLDQRRVSQYIQCYFHFLQPGFQKVVKQQHFLSESPHFLHRIYNIDVANMRFMDLEFVDCSFLPDVTNRFRLFNSILTLSVFDGPNLLNYVCDVTKDFYFPVFLA